MSKYFKNSEGNVYQSYSGAPYQAEDTHVSKKDGEKAMREQAVKHLKTLVRTNQKVYTILNHISSSGMSRSISLCVVHKGDLIKLDYWIAQALGENIDNKNGGLKVSGCGMDIGFHLVYQLGRTLWPHGTAKPHGTRNGAHDRDGGYALNHVWL